MAPSMSIKHMQQRPSQQTDQKSIISPHQIEKKGSHIFQTKLSTAGLLNHSMTHNSSLNTIQTAVGPGIGANFDQGFSINEYVNEQISLLEKTKVLVAAKKSKKTNKQKKHPVLINHSAHPSGIILPNIQTNGSARVVRDSNSTRKANSLIEDAHKVLKNSKGVYILNGSLHFLK